MPGGPAKPGRVWAIAGLLCCALLAAPAPAQQLGPPVAPAAPQLGLPVATAGAPAADDGAALLRATAMPITLPIALRLSLTTNLDIAQAREFVAQAGIALDRARAGYLPTFNLGSAYNHHEGNIQKTEGN